MRNKSNFSKEKHEKTFNYLEICHTREAEVRDTFQWGREIDTILNFLFPFDYTAVAVSGKVERS